MCMEKPKEYINLLDERICRECERKITGLSIDDIEYEYYSMMIKKIWSKYLVKYNESY